MAMPEPRTRTHSVPGSLPPGDVFIRVYVSDITNADVMTQPGDVTRGIIHFPRVWSNKSWITCEVRPVV